ncbi:HAUS augmin-like complex subunit 8 [Tupaia chinensis]|uniref:HAUS augmin-like complex subunit 8 n=1 Tax=Tupaia chinensis TaxID=246437 RepID=UPI000703CFE7|nr:HAUS augmin-like complex subunit 8 [Tupaia chinensis]
MPGMTLRPCSSYSFDALVHCATCKRDETGRKPSAADPSTLGARPKEKKPPGGRVIESRYLKYEKKTNKTVTQKTPAADVSKSSGKTLEGRRDPSLLQKSKADSSGMGKSLLQSTLLEGHGAAPPDLDLSAINEKSALRKTPQLDKGAAKKPKPKSFSAPQKKSPTPSEAMETLESQTVLLTLLTVKMEKGLADFEQKAEKNLLTLCREKERLQKEVHELRRKLLLDQRKRKQPLPSYLQIEMLSPFEAASERFREQYKTFATALDTTRHELPVKSIHLEGDGQQALDALQAELQATQHLLGELGIGTLEDNVKVLHFLSELKELTSRKDQELRRYVEEVHELSAEASKEAALANQEVWEEAQGPETASRWYFSQDGACGDSQGGHKSPHPSRGTLPPHSQEESPSCTCRSGRDLQ